MRPVRVILSLADIPPARLLRKEIPMLTTRQIRHATVPATVASAAAAWALATHVAGVHLSVRFPHSTVSTVGVGTIVAAASVATLFGWGLLTALEGRARNPRKIWMTAALVIFLASLGLPIAFATTTSAMIGLIAIHLTVVVVAVTGLAWAAPRAGVVSATASARMSPSQPLA